MQSLTTEEGVTPACIKKHAITTMILQIIIVTTEHLWVASLYKCHILIVVTPSQMFRLSVVRYNLGSMANVIISHNHCLLSLSATKVTIQCLKQPILLAVYSSHLCRPTSNLMKPTNQLWQLASFPHFHRCKNWTCAGVESLDFFFSCEQC